DNGTTSYRARFLVRRWLAPVIEVRLPGPLAGPNPEFFRDDEKVEAIPVPDAGGSDRGFRIPLPEPRPERTTVIEVRYQLPAGRWAVGDSTYQPPALPGATFVGPVRWQVTVPSGSVPLLSSGASAELHWRWRGGLLAASGMGNDELDRWFRAGGEAAGGE